MYTFAQTLSADFAESEVGTGAVASAKLGFVAIFDNGHRLTPDATRPARPQSLIGPPGSAR